MRIYYTKQQCTQQLDAWEKASRAIALNKKYMIGTRSITRADVDEVKEMIEFWQDQLSKIELLENHKATNRLFRVIPRDI